MRILHLISRLDHGGAENQVTDLAEACSTRGHHIAVAARYGRRVALLPDGVVFRRVRFHPLLRVFSARAVRSIIRRERIDLVHAHQREPTIVGALVCRSTRTPLVVTLHSQFDWDLDLEWVRPHINRLIVVSKCWSQTVKGFDPDLASRSRVVTNGVRAPRLDTPRTPTRIVYASRIDEFHGRVLVDLVREGMPRIAEGFEDAQLIVAGDGPLLARVERAARQTNADLGYTAVTCVGYQQDLSPLMASAAVVLGVGRVALEALAQATPVVLVNHAHLGSLVTPQTFDRDIHTNLVPVGGPAPSPGTLVKQIMPVLGCFDDSLRAAGRVCTMVRGSCMMDQVCEDTLSVYEEALEDPV